jgi:predicted O-methyltransferase YrrM
MIRFLTTTTRRTRFLWSCLRAKRIYAANQHIIPTVDPKRFLPGIYAQCISFRDVGSAESGTTVFELYLMVCLLRLFRPRAIFEFGTSEGRTTLQFALNAPQDATIYTLDLPEDSPATRFRRSYPNEASVRKLSLGGLFESSPESPNIKQLLQDSAAVNFEPFRGRMDFILIDGDHGIDYVKSDSENAFHMLSPRGVILWHDYGGIWPDVARYLRSIAAHRAIYHLAGTSLAIYMPTRPILVREQAGKVCN